jgi:hypothetical protein
LAARKGSVGRLDATTGEDKRIGQENLIGATPSHQHARNGRGAIDDDEGGRVARP